MKMLNQSVDCLQKYSLFMGDTICFTGWLLLPTLGIPTVALRLQNRWDFHGFSAANMTIRLQGRKWGLHTSEIMRCLPIMGTCEIHSWESASKEDGRRSDEMAMRSGWDEECPYVPSQLRCKISHGPCFTWFFLLIPWLPCFFSIFLCWKEFAIGFIH